MLLEVVGVPATARQRHRVEFRIRHRRPQTAAVRSIGRRLFRHGLAAVALGAASFIEGGLDLAALKACGSQG